MAHGGKREGSGRKKGSKASHTLLAEQAKIQLIQAYLDNITPINNALIKKATEGDIQAIKEIHDRVYGKAPQAITGPEGRTLEVIISGESAERFKVK